MDDSRTVWCGNLAEQVTEEILYELFLQAAPLERVKIPADRGRKSNFGFITFKHEVSVPYAVQLLNGIKLFEKSLNIKPRNGGAQREQNVLQNPLSRSISYPNDSHELNTHIRFSENENMGPPHVSYDDLMHLGQMMNVNYDYQRNFDFQHDIDYNFGNNSNYQGPNQTYDRHRERNNHRGRAQNRKDYNRARQEPRNEYERDRRNDYHGNGRNNRKDDRRNNFDRGNNRRNKRY